MTKTPRQHKAPSTIGIAVGALSGAVACAVLAIVAYASGNDSFGKGIVQGGTIGIAVMVTLLIISRTRFSTAEARVVSGRGDERENQFALRAASIGFIVMYAAAIVATFLHSFGVEAEAGFAIIMFSGLIASLASFAVLVRRG